VGGAVVNGSAEFFAAPAPGLGGGIVAFSDAVLLPGDDLSPYDGFLGGVFVAAGLG
jgi:hypothetical protein